MSFEQHFLYIPTYRDIIIESLTWVRVGVE